VIPKAKPGLGDCRASFPEGCCPSPRTLPCISARVRGGGDILAASGGAFLFLGWHLLGDLWRCCEEGNPLLALKSELGTGVFAPFAKRLVLWPLTAVSTRQCGSAGGALEGVNSCLKVPGP